MHELGIVFHIAKMVENAARQNNVKRIAKVTLEIGEVSAIVNDYLEDCWNWNAKKSELLKDSKLEIINIKAVSYCDACHKEYETVKYGKICPQINRKRLLPFQIRIRQAFPSHLVFPRFRIHGQNLSDKIRTNIFRHVSLIPQRSNKSQRIHELLIGHPMFIRYIPA